MDKTPASFIPTSSTERMILNFMGLMIFNIFLKRPLSLVHENAMRTLKELIIEWEETASDTKRF